jgi:hypothetical protein
LPAKTGIGPAKWRSSCRDCIADRELQPTRSAASNYRIIATLSTPINDQMRLTMVSREIQPGPLRGLSSKPGLKTDTLQPSV